MNDGLNTAKLRKLADMMERVRGLDAEMPAQTLLTLLLVAAGGSEGVRQTTISEKLESKSAASRIIAILSFERHDLISVETEEDRRFRRLKLTAKGHREVKRLLECLD